MTPMPPRRVRLQCRFRHAEADLIRYLDKELKNLMIETGKNGQLDGSICQCSQRAAVLRRSLAGLK